MAELNECENNPNYILFHWFDQMCPTSVILCSRKAILFFGARENKNKCFQKVTQIGTCRENLLSFD